MGKLNKIKRKGFLAAFSAISIAFSSAMSVMAAVPSLSASSYIKMYGLSTKDNTYVYTNETLSTRGTSSPYKKYNSCIYSNDELYVYSIGNSSAYVSYPTSSGRRYGYVRTSDLTANNYSRDVQVSTGKITTYRRAGASGYGYVEKGDKVYTLASSNGYKQIIYPISGTTWKSGWVKDSDYNRYIGKSGGSNGSQTGTVSSKAQKIADYAMTQVGIGDSKGNNDVVYNTWYYGQKVKGSGYAWCQAFVSYCAEQTGSLYTAVPRTASCQEAVSYFKGKGLFHKSKYYGGSYSPKVGDIVYYTTNGSTSNHVGIIIGTPDNGYLQVVEGNVLSGSGDYKVIKFTSNLKRRVTSSYVLGYATPNY